MTDTFHDALVEPGTTDLPERFFDRFVFNLHPVDASSPTVLLGLGVHPRKDVVDGFAILVTASEQRNVRFSTALSATDGTNAGPFSWQVREPMRTWHLALGPNPGGMEFDLLWHARTPAWIGEVKVANDQGDPTSFAHLFQSGRYEGTLTIDGHRQTVDGWYGQRDRSRGVRTMSGGQGMHVWYQAQFPDRSIGFLLVETRRHERLLLEGAVMHESGELDTVVDVRHDLRFDENLDLEGGMVEVTTASGEVYEVDTDASARGGYMSGGGYGGHHGRSRGRDHLEHDVYPLDGSVAPRTLDSALTDRPAAFTWNGTPGRGIFEFALTRSRSYAYQPTLR
ncbi:hypothetical protein SLNWT_6948 [Streptomyces albus]|uniref:Uncharacterized protein n=1 Tax=Streptomyces albus (strain ATCC 21838 / DSM 41398 / FERM P-419 / JCM 4703 / NBRC 107858) TaxID=1081613 RepID=A0A0B5EZT9_STRA4|nr:hypothetical protein SLNWT_6948 [Streptomyces albus]AOU81627.1 hypothetical protein SLNHY_6936 [Streptomyces albus]AYN37318.1 hypothetical protein DUI70_6825 [Streptomyces albus]